MQAVTADLLSKTYAGGKTAVDNVSLALEQGEVFGFLGPNGAGKTTTVRLLCGTLAPTGGSCRVFGVDPTTHPEQVHQFSGILTEHAQMYDYLTGMQNLTFYGTAFGVSESECESRGLELLEQLDLLYAKDQKLATYSTGMRQRLSLARAMIHKPKMLFLDEPTSGLDPESILSVNSMIKSLASKQGTTIFLCTHQLRYAQEICNSYGLIDDGALLAWGSIEKLRSLVFSGMTLSVKADKVPDTLKPSASEDGCFEIKVQSEHEIPGIIRDLVERGSNIYRVSAQSLSLEEIYFDLLAKRMGSRKGEQK